MMLIAKNEKYEYIGLFNNSYLIFIKYINNKSIRFNYYGVNGLDITTFPTFDELLFISNSSNYKYLKFMIDLIHIQSNHSFSEGFIMTICRIYAKSRIDI